MTDEEYGDRVESLAKAWLLFQGYTEEEIALGESQTCQNSGCCFEYPQWCCIDGDTDESNHPELDVLGDAIEWARFAVEHLDEKGKVDE